MSSTSYKRKDKMIAVDIETVDPLLSTKGDGSIRKDGKITGVAFYDGTRALYLRPDDPRVSELLSSSETKVFHNGVYDLAWLQSYGFTVNGKWEDTLTRASLINPDANAFSLDHCAKRLGLAGKNKESTIEQWGKDHGIKNIIKHMDQVPFEVQAEYAKQDVMTTYQLFERQQNWITSKKLQGINDVEAKVLKVIMRMKKNGIAINEPARDRLIEEWEDRIADLEDDLVFEAGIVNTNASAQIEYFFHSEGIKSPFLTEKGNESWDKTALDAIDHPVAKKIKDIKHLKTLMQTFLKGGLQDTVNGRIHTTLYPTHRDEGGTITGRLSSAHPNLQNIPASGAEGKAIRSLFIPEEGCLFGAFDYTQIEYRLFAHYAIMLQSVGYKELQSAMANGKDYHQHVMDMLGWPSEMRKLAKTLNFGVLYGMGKAKCIKQNRRLFKPNVGQTVEQYADWVYETYFRTLPFVKPTCNTIQDIALNQGYVRSIGGRLHVTEMGRAYKSVNKLIQGGAADILKIGLVEAEEKGLWDVLTLHLTVHDENDFSIPQTKEGMEAAKELERCMQTSLSLNVPIGIDMETGTNWGNVA
jgi:DNA polymerase-1